eukprot:8948253-Alexandrium_andersonii.AAC.1
MPPDRRAMLDAAMAGAIWTPHEALNAGHIEDGTCPWCSEEACDVEHLLWRCQRFERHRGDVREAMRVLSIAQLPKSLMRHCLPPMQSAALAGPLWVGGGQDEYTHQEHFAELCSQ